MNNLLHWLTAHFTDMLCAVACACYAVLVLAGLYHLKNKR